MSCSKLQICPSLCFNFSPNGQQTTSIKRWWNLEPVVLRMTRQWMLAFEIEFDGRPVLIPKGTGNSSGGGSRARHVDGKRVATKKVV